jgi:hypothetical protein
VSPSSGGSHQVKLESTVALLLTTSLINTNYTILYRLRRGDLGAPLATLQISNNTSVNIGTNLSEIPTLTWNDNISTSVTYTVTIQVNTSTGLTSVTAQTRALNAIVF